jgi:nucleotide-binding universal stress UspA family protein
MYTRLAVALDGSSQAEKALPVAVQLAKALPARLLLFHVRMEPEDTGENWQSEPGKSFRPEEYLNQLKEVLTDPTKGWALPSEQVQAKVQYGRFAYELGEIAAAEGVDLVIMTTHGRSGLSLLVLGSIATGVLKHTRRPVLLLRPVETSLSLEEALETFNQKPVQIMLTLDGSPKAEAALEPATALADQLKATLHLVEVITPVPPVIMVEPGLDYLMLDDFAQAQAEVLTKDALHYLERVQEWIKGKAPRLKVDITVLNGFPASQLEASIRKAKPFLVVMATHARSEFGQILLGSVAEEVLRESHSPVMMVPIPKGFEGYGLQIAGEHEEKTGKKPVTTANK